MTDKPSSDKRDKALSRGVFVTKKVLISMLAGFCLTVLSLWVPVTLKSSAELDNMRFGKPFAYMIQTFSRTVPDEWFPGRVTPKFSSGYSTELDMGMFCASLAVNTLICAAVITLLWYIKKRRALLHAEKEPVQDGFAVTDDKKNNV